MKRVLGLDLGTASIGWAMVNVAESAEEHSEILGCGARVIPISVDEKDSFEKGKSISTNADRTLKRGMRRNLQRRKLRRENLKSILKEEGWINADSSLSEQGLGSTYQTLELRSRAASEQVSLEELSKVLLSINKKRGYKSSRKADSLEEGHLIDGMEIAKELYKSGMTPAQYCTKASNGEKWDFEFYRSDLEAELKRIWSVQKGFYPELLTDVFWEQLTRQGKTGTSRAFFAKYGIYTADNKGKERKKQGIKWRVSALSDKLEKEVLAYVIADLRGLISESSGYLGEISDRSKELYFNNETVGQYLYRNIKGTPGFSTRNKVFYRKDYMDEFERIWKVQSGFHPEMTDSLKCRIEDTVVFYQRPLKSQKKNISFCGFESHPIEVIVDGKRKSKITGSRVAPRSSLLFQEFKIWQQLNNISIVAKGTWGERALTTEEKEHLAEELSIRAKMTPAEVFKALGLGARKYEINYDQLDGNATLAALFSKYCEIITISGHLAPDLKKMTAHEAKSIVQELLSFLGVNTDILSFDGSLQKEAYEQQPLFKLWHLLYSYEGDSSPTGDVALVNKITALTGLEREYAKCLSTVSFKEDYASLSHKAIRKILPHLKTGLTYDKACAEAGYSHSHSITKEENEKRALADQLEQLPKGALRNPVVEKIINQMINVVNAAAEVYGRPDEIHIELARELKKSAKERESASRDIEANKKRNEDIERILREEFHLSSVRKNDIVRYRLYEELKENGYKTLYSNKYIPREILFSKDIDIEHIIPQALLFDDSFANKTIEYKDINIEKGRKVANDYVKEKYGEEGYIRYCSTVNDLRERGIISEKKRKYLLMTEEEIPSGFIDRELRDTQYISKKSKEILQTFVRDIVPTTGSVTERLREEWQLVDVMKEINFPKYEKAGKTFIKTDSDGRRVKRITDWTKRNDHRHHAMDAITIAFTKREHIQILNNLNARSRKDPAFMSLFEGNTTMAGSKRIFAPPMPMDELRASVRKHLDNALVSVKAKNKVVTRNVNKTKTADGYHRSIELTPRGELHKEQVYGLRKIYETALVPVGGKMTEDIIATVASPKIREALMARLREYNGNAKKAFTGKNSVSERPIWIDSAHTQAVPEKVKCLTIKTVYSIRKDVTPDLKLDKILDAKARQRIKERIDEYGGDAKAALSNLDLNPIWLDEKHTIPIKRVTIAENFNLYAIRNKRDKNGALMKDADGNLIPSDYVNLRNNHHVAIYRDADGQLQEVVVPMFEALNRINSHSPVVDKNYHSDLGWRFVFSMKENEMFVFPDEATGFDPIEINLADEQNASIISPHLFRVQKLSSKDYCFRHHQETAIEYDPKLRDITWKRIQNVQKMDNVVKVRVDHLGRIVAIGEYD